MYKFQYLRKDAITGKITKVVEMYLHLYESCLEQERIYNRLYNGHAIIRAI